MIATRAHIHGRTVRTTVTPERFVQALAGRERPVMVPFADHVLVACDPVEVVTDADVWEALRIPCTRRSDGPQAAVDGWIGLLAYDLGGSIERLPPPHDDPSGPPVAALGRYDTLAAFDAYGGCTVLSSRSESAVATLAAEIEDTAREPDEPPVAGAVTVTSSLDAAAYRAAVDRARDLIRAGDCYQVNLTQRLSAPWTHGPGALAERLWRAAGGADHRAYVGLAEGTVVSASPERLVRVRDGIAESEPIKGTAPIGEWERLAVSAKDRAEHVMIVDLVRNDLGRVARAGGVSVPRLFAYLSTPYVEHMVSEVRAELAAGVTAADVLRAVFPGGSVTGTPKVRAMEVIHELEPVSRGPAFGSVVAVGTDGAMEASITIRTAWVTSNEVRYWCGGAVVWDSDPDAERAEAWAKATPFLQAIGAT